MNANAEFGNDGLLAIWRDVTTEPVWRYKEVPPFLLSELTKVDSLEASDSELSRVMWFWSRRPKLMFYSRTALMLMVLCVLISLSIALVNWHLAWVPKRAGEVIVILLEVAVEIYAIRHRLRFLRWRREYERSIDRLLRTIYPGV